MYSKYILIQLTRLHVYFSYVTQLINNLKKLDSSIPTSYFHIIIIENPVRTNYISPQSNPFTKAPSGYIIILLLRLLAYTKTYVTKPVTLGAIIVNIITSFARKPFVKDWYAYFAQSYK